MKWAEFHDLFLGKYFLNTAHHVKAEEFLELKQEAMMVIEYVTRFKELARFADDYVTTDMAKVRRFENGLKLSIRGKIVGLHLQDMDTMVRTTLTIKTEREREREREIEDARSTRDAGVSSKRKESQSSSSSGKKQRASSSGGFQGRDHLGQGQIRVSSHAGKMVCYHCQ